MKLNKLFLLLLIQLSIVFNYSSVGAQVSCEKLFAGQLEILTTAKVLAERGEALPARSGTTQRLAEFAAKHSLPYKWIELGPPERRVKRLFVAIDINNQMLMQEYRESFNLHTALGGDTAGTLALEFNKESLTIEHYISGVLRVSDKLDDPIYRWGRPDASYRDWINQIGIPHSRFDDHNKTGFLIFSHLIDLNFSERENVKLYLQHSDVYNPSDVVGKCKSNNCVAWTSGIELGKSEVGASEEQRKHLFNELGVARAMAHFEIGRRLIHGASDRHTAIAVFVDGKKGLENFDTQIAENLVPLPKIPYSSIIKNLKIESPALQVVKHVQDGEKVFFPIAAGASPEAFSALVDHANSLKTGIDIHVLVNGISEKEFRRGLENNDKIRVHALFLGGNLRGLYKQGKVSVIPGNLSDFTRIMNDPNRVDFHYDTIFVRVSKPENGRYSLGPNNDMIMSIIRNRPNIKIIAEVNENIPFTYGKNVLLENQIHSKFHSNSSLAGPPVVPPNDIDRAIGKHIGSLVDSKSVLQIGIGNIFSGVADGLQFYGKNEITIFTEMFGDTMMDIMERGIAVKAKTGFAFGSTELYRWLHKNENVEMVETEYVNSPGRVARMQRFHAVNTALQVNLYGEVNATMGPDGRISSPGGQVEFMTGAARSKNGKAIIAIRSTAKDGALSSIVLNLYPGPITTPHESVTHVVTEYGVAELYGKTESQRAINLIRIAHPKFRKELLLQAQQKGLITQNMMMKELE